VTAVDLMLSAVIVILLGSIMCGSDFGCALT